MKEVYRLLTFIHSSTARTRSCKGENKEKWVEKCFFHSSVLRTQKRNGEGISKSGIVNQLLGKAQHLNGFGFEYKSIVGGGWRP